MPSTDKYEEIEDAQIDDAPEKIKNKVHTPEVEIEELEPEEFFVDVKEAHPGSG